MTFYPYLCKRKQQGNSPTKQIRIMLQIDFPKVNSEVNALYDSEFNDYSDIKFKEKYNRVVNLPIDDIIRILGVPNTRIEYNADSWYLNVDDDIILISLTIDKISRTYNKIQISTTNTKNEDLELILKYFLFLSKGYKNLLEKKTNSELLELVDTYFNADVWYDFAFDTDSESKVSFKKVLREFLINKLLDEVSLHELISDGYIELDY